MCGEGGYLCEDSDICIHRSKVCDGNKDCPNDDDEIHCRKFIGWLVFNAPEHKVLSRNFFDRSSSVVRRRRLSTFLFKLLP